LATGAATGGGAASGAERLLLLLLLGIGVRVLALALVERDDALVGAGSDAAALLRELLDLDFDELSEADTERALRSSEALSFARRRRSWRAAARCSCARWRCSRRASASGFVVLRASPSAPSRELERWW
jgi:hypothetical protein